MRIVGYIENKPCKITVFHQGFRYMVKFEDGLYEQSFKFRESENVNGLSDIQNIIDDQFIDEVMHRFVEMKNSTSNLMERYIHQISGEYFEEETII